MIAALVALALLMIGALVAAALAMVYVQSRVAVAGLADSHIELPSGAVSAAPSAPAVDWANPAWLGTFAGDTDTGHYSVTFTDDDPVTGILLITGSRTCRMEVRQDYRFTESSVAARLLPLAHEDCGRSALDLVVSGDRLTLNYRSATYVLPRV
ncbi:hypothetical protein [Gordonia alkaliphila]